MTALHLALIIAGWLLSNAIVLIFFVSAVQLGKSHTEQCDEESYRLHVDLINPRAE